MLQPGADPVRKVSIIPRGRALGVTLSAPEQDRYGYDETYLRGRISGALGGMAAEQEVFNVVTTGAESDLQAVTSIARSMVGRWGMSERIGKLSVLPAEGDPRMAGISEDDAIAEFVGLLETSSMRARPGVDYPGRVDLPQRLVSEEPEGPVLAVARGSDATVPRGFREFWGVASGVVERGLADFPGCFLGGIGRWFALTILWTRVLGDRRSILILRRCWS